MNTDLYKRLHSLCALQLSAPSFANSHGFVLLYGVSYLIICYKSIILISCWYVMQYKILYKNANLFTDYKEPFVKNEKHVF